MAFLATSVLCTACTGSDGSPEAEPEVDPVVFCTEAEAFITDDSVTEVANFGPEFFSEVDRRLAALVDTAPDAIASDFVALQAGFAESDRIFGAFDYDVTSPDLVAALDQIDQDSMLTATENIEAYLASECGLVLEEDEPSVPIDDAQVADIIEVFGVDEELARCLNRELGDIANIDSEELTPELMTRSVCDTTLVGILSGTG